jgi:hypothetical protein
MGDKIELKDDRDRNRIRLDADTGNIWAGGNGADGDLVIFPRGADDIDDASQATIHLDGDTGTLNLRGNIRFTAPVTPDRQLPGWSVDQGATAAFQGTRRGGLIDFTHTHPPAKGDREKLREIWIFNPEIDDQALVLLTVHQGAPAAFMVSHIGRHSISGGEGHYINVEFTRKINPGNRIRIKYQIIN